MNRLAREKTRNEGTMTEAAFFGCIRSALRELAFRRRLYLPTKNAKERQRVERGRYECENCGDVFPAKYIQVDHIDPAGRLKSFDDLPDFCRRLFCDSDGLQVLCKVCHHNKTHGMG